MVEATNIREIKGIGEKAEPVEKEVAEKKPAAKRNYKRNAC